MTRSRDLSAIAAAVIAAAGSSEVAAEALRHYQRQSIPRCACGHDQTAHRGPSEPRSGKNAVPPCSTADPRVCPCTGYVEAS